jgi:hypothetical protein
MKPRRFLQGCLSVLTASLLLSFVVQAQVKKRSVANNVYMDRLSANQQDAIELLRGLAKSLKSEPDKLAAATVQAQIADVLWKFDEAFARDVFGWAFDATRQPAAENLAAADRTAYIARQASSIRHVLTRLGAHDRAQADAFLKILEEDRATKSTSSKPTQFHSELLLQIALQLAPTDPEQAFQLGVLSLAGDQVPQEFGNLLFSLSNVSKSLSDKLFRTALLNLRRNNFAYNNALLSLVNYLFSSDGILHSDATVGDAQLLANYFVDAAWRQARGAQTSALPDASAMFYSLAQTRGLPIVAKYAAERLPELQGQLRELEAGLTPAQVQHTAMMQANQQQQITISNRNTYDLEEQIERAKNEKDPDVRDSLLNSIAHTLMREDSKRALGIAGMIDAAEVRKEAENDINLVRIQKLLSSGSYDEARKITQKLDRAELQARLLIELANKVLSDRDTALAMELLTEASEKILKTDSTPDKAVTLLSIAQQLTRIDTTRGFEVLGSAISTINQLKAEVAPARSVLTKPRPLRIKTYTVLNGNELSTSDRATVESINFSQITPFVVHDYIQTRLLANKLEQSLWRVKFLAAVGSAMLLAPEARPETGFKSSN